MSAIEQLEKSLHHIGQVALAKLRPGDALQMLYERTLLEKWIGAVLEQEELTGDRVLDALEMFYKSQGFKSLRQARLVCYGLTQVFGTQSHRLIDDIEYLTLLLKYLDRNQSRIRPYRKCYRGLLSCYFSYDPQGSEATVEGRRNWEILRDYLYGHRDMLRTPGYNPDWVEALSGEPALLSMSPFWKYTFDKLQGDWSSLDEIQQRLEIGEDSWFMQRLVLEQVKAVTTLDDEGFRAYIDHILLLLSSHQLYAGTGLSMLLDRYAQCARKDESSSLMDFAVNLWGNPWLVANAQYWRCGSAAREMVASWLKRHLLNQFFSLFSDGEATGRRRRNFWELYCEDMQGMYFALGKDAFAPGKMDLYKFRNDAKGLVVKLSDGAHDLHAFIMQFDRYHVVEFSRNNNVAYFYDTRHGPPPFYFSEGWIKVGALSVGNALKGGSPKPISKSLQHKDSKALLWEGRFAQEMGTTENSIKTFCRKYQCRYKDLRGQADRQWIIPASHAKCGQEAHAVLMGWGFVWSPEKGGYFHVAD
ncbi:MAG: hypothetical protein GC149_12735 [Gammaproteobacteria bacterium]|nr:hypothetical protein [Gammaproteobacteria bacterium]